MGRDELICARTAVKPARLPASAVTLSTPLLVLGISSMKSAAASGKKMMASINMSYSVPAASEPRVT